MTDLFRIIHIKEKVNGHLDQYILGKTGYFLSWVSAKS